MKNNGIVDQPLPHSKEAERAVLGAILLDSAGAEEAIARIDVADFFIPIHRVIFRHMKLFLESGMPTNDPVLLYESLRASDEVEAAGGLGYLSQLPEGLPRISNISHYAEIVILKARLRVQAVTAEKIREMAIGANGDALEVLHDIAILSATLREEVWQKGINFVSGADFATGTEESVEWIAKGYVAKGAITEIGAKVKSGKTTLVTEIVHAALDGKSFLGHPTLKTPTVYLTEQPPVSFRQTMKRAGLLGRRDFHFLPRSAVPRMSWPEVAAATVAECKRVGASLMVVDTLPQFAGLSGDAENNSGDALKAMQPLQQAAAQGIAVISVRHERKSGGDVGDSGRGSSAFAGAVDIVVSLRRPDGNGRTTLRVLHALSRFSETPSELRVDLTQDGYICLGEPCETARESAKTSILEILPRSQAEAIDIKELIDRGKICRGTLNNAIDDLERQGSLGRVGRGSKGSPYRYFRMGN
jgi:DnaB-like helicase N terminal domain/AAA domain